MECAQVQQQEQQRATGSSQPAGFPPVLATGSSNITTTTNNNNNNEDDDNNWLLLSESGPLMLYDDNPAALVHPDILGFLDVLTATGDNEDLTIDSTTSEAHSERQRKRTYEQRKSEMDALKQQAAQLEAMLESRKRTVGIPDKRTLAQERIEATMLREIARNHQYAIAGLQSQLAQGSSEHAAPPASRPIHLGTDPTQRRTTLETMKAQHLRDAQRFLAVRSAFNAPTVRFADSTRWQDDAGDTFATTFDIVPLPFATSVKQVYDALLFGWFNVEICIADRFGDTAVREECDTGDASISHHRLVGSSLSHGVLIETNSVLFTEHTQPQQQQRQCEGEAATLVSDFVDTDALYPYVPAQRVRKDMTSAAMVQWRAPLQSSSSGDPGTSQPVVVLTMWVQSKLHSSSIRHAISDDRFEALTEETPDHMAEALLAAVHAACTPGSAILADDEASTSVLPPGAAVSL